MIHCKIQPSQLETKLLKPRILTLALALAAGAAPASAHAAAAFDVAVTVDDLTVHGALPRGMSWTGIGRSHIATLKAHRVPQAWGFVNGKRIVEQPESAAVLDDWRRAGHPLGNHTYSHLGLSGAPSLQAWIDDATAGEAAIAARMANADWRVLRFPFLDGGADPARHDGAAAWLKSRGYRIADVSLSFDDWAYGDTYARCMDKGDQAAIAAMKAGYLQRVDAIIAATRALSQRVYGRMIPQVLLTHMGPWGAATLPDVLARLDAAGARYATLEQVQADAAYREPSPRAGNGMLMERRAQDAGIGLAGLPLAPPVGKLDALCRQE
ncbi:MAG: Polysaccharide deacetylase [Massilia sp.]|nr:Polysaccharide deacetylase [Massilia sp.]